jgi:hypothetical protein
MAAIRTNRAGASYYALRAGSRATAGAWWDAVRERHDAPPAIAALLAGRMRVELGRDEAERALAWAAGVEGWERSEPKPVALYAAGAAAPTLPADRG